ncbi:MAG: hypothetical protein U9R74_10840 [Pseudomonadota bacterium]|nr:hypothetical protein [Pseudomonadota bacterium]
MKYRTLLFIFTSSLVCLPAVAEVSPSPSASSSPPALDVSAGVVTGEAAEPAGDGQRYGGHGDGGHGHGKKHGGKGGCHGKDGAHGKQDRHADVIARLERIEQRQVLIEAMLLELIPGR